MMTTIADLARTEDLDNNWNRLIEITSTLIVSGQLSSRDAMSADDELARYMLLLNDVRHDRMKEDVCLLGMRRAPASKNRHHNVEGGLVRHLLQMWEIWVGMKAILRDHRAQHPLLNDANVWKCILHHDLNKVWKYRLENGDPWKVDYASDTDRLTYLLGDVNKVMFLLSKHGIHLSLPLFNGLITAEGGFSLSPRPKTESVLAKMAYLLDEMSANVIDRLQTNRFWDSKEGGIRENGDQ
jgi:hypothetical protein